jgi:hypothetical protein
MSNAYFNAETEEDTTAVWAWSDVYQNRYGDEYLKHHVGVCDDGGPTGKVYNCASREKAITLGERMAKDRGLEFVNDTVIS